MPFDHRKERAPCILCGEPDSNESKIGGWDVAVSCSDCGDFKISHVTADDIGLPLKEAKELALARYMLRKMQKQVSRPLLDAVFFRTLRERQLPSPAEACDNLLRWFAEKAEFRPGKSVFISHLDEKNAIAEVGVLDCQDFSWLLGTLERRGLLEAVQRAPTGASGHYGMLSAEGWERFEELQRAHIASNYAFFARKFENAELDSVFEECLRPAVQQTGFELRMVTQRAGPIDAIMEDEIRRCKFLIADLSDDNPGAYWEAGFAEGLGKPVIYVCREKTVEGSEKKNTHFDTEHRHTVRWDLDSLDETRKELKAVIRNTLLGEAKQDD